MKRLTADVFDMELCPEWVKLAVVNRDGTLAFGDFETANPNKYNGGWRGESTDLGWMCTEEQLDASTYPDGCIILKPIEQEQK